MSEFEKQTDECIAMTSNHRKCFPDGERMILATEAQCLALIQERNVAIKEKNSAKMKIDAANAETRTWQVLAAAFGLIGIAAGFITGILV